ncbi:MAG: hypothetical protein ACK56I_04910, partial [bacterium]
AQTPHRDRRRRGRAGGAVERHGNEGERVEGARRQEQLEPRGREGQRQHLAEYEAGARAHHVDRHHAPAQLLGRAIENPALDDDELHRVDHAVDETQTGPQPGIGGQREDQRDDRLDRGEHGEGADMA